MKYSESVSKLVIRCIKDNAFDSYISETFVPLKSIIKPKKQTRVAGDLVTSVKTIPARRTRPYPPKWTINAGDPDLLIPIELSQARADRTFNQDLKGNLSAVTPKESHQSKETLPKNHLANSKLKGVTAPLQIALLIPGLIHPPKMKYTLNVTQ